MRLILASASPRRQELLRNGGIDFIVMPADIPEIPSESEAPQEFAERMAREKAQRVWMALPEANSRSVSQGSATLVLGADTVVVVDDEILGKPIDANDSARMLRLLAGRKHRVITGVCLTGEGFQNVSSEITIVQFAEMSDSDIAAYVASGEPMDKAGAYAIQGMASRWITKVEGDYSNVVGLPVDLVRRMLGERGFRR